MIYKFAITAALVGISAGPAAAQQDWTWHKVIPAGKTVEIRGVIGDITATPASGSEVEVVAHKTGDADEASSVRISAVERDGGVTICAIYDDDMDCDSEGRGHSHSRDNDTKVDFQVRVPRGVQFTARTVVGKIEATGLSADVDASTVTGDVTVSTTGLVAARSVSGSLMLRMGRAEWTGSLDFSTVSGNITLEFAGDLNTDVSMNTVSGEFSSDWPVSVRTTNSRRVAGTIGSGGRRLALSTVSGDVELRKQR